MIINRENQSGNALNQSASIKVQSFGWGLRIALLLPILAALLGWLSQLFIRFPAGSLGASLTAGLFVLAPFAEIIPVPVAIAKLARHASLRTITTITLTVFGTMLLFLGILLVLALFF